MEKLVVRGTEISVQWNSSRDDFISLTDIAKLKDSDNPRYIIQNWLRNRNTIEFLGVWESLYNPEFNRVEFDAFRSQAGLNSFVMTPQKWVEATGAIGIVSKAGRYGGTYALMLPCETIIFEGIRSSYMIRFTRCIGPIHKAAHA